MSLSLREFRPLCGELNNRAKRDTIILNFQFSILNYSKRRSQWKS